MHQHQAGAEPVEEGLSGFWQMSTAFNGSQHANPRSSATRFIGKRANSPSGGKRPSTHAQIQYARMRIGCRTRIAGAITAEAPTRRRPKTKFQFDLQEKCDCGSLDKLHLAQIGDFSLKRRDLPENPKFTGPNRPQSQLSCKLARKIVAAAGQKANPRTN